MDGRYIDHAGLLTYPFSEVLGNDPYATDGVGQARGRPPRDFADQAAQAAATGVWTPSARPSPRPRSIR